MEFIKLYHPHDDEGEHNFYVPVSSITRITLQLPDRFQEQDGTESVMLYSTDIDGFCEWMASTARDIKKGLHRRTNPLELFACAEVEIRMPVYTDPALDAHEHVVYEFDVDGIVGLLEAMNLKSSLLKTAREYVKVIGNLDDYCDFKDDSLHGAVPPLAPGESVQ